jgi:isopropylmalate/homocitrate/citramalate synthase
MTAAVTLTDVALREHGQNVPASGLDRFTPEFCVRTAQGLVEAGVRRLELISCVSPRVAPAMSAPRIREIADRFGRWLRDTGQHAAVEIVTLVPNPRMLDSFFELGLGPGGPALARSGSAERSGAGHGHTVGVFHSAVEAHNRQNLGRDVAGSLDWIREVARRAAERAVPLVAYVSAAFGFRPRPNAEIIDASLDGVTRYVQQLRAWGARTVTLSDLQGLRTPAETRDRLGALFARLDADAPTWLGYHPHHADPTAGVALAEAAWEAGIRLLDGSLGAVGGCVTGAPGNAPTEGLLQMLRRRGVDPGVDPVALARVSREFDVVARVTGSATDA